MIIYYKNKSEKPTTIIIFVNTTLPIFKQVIKFIIAILIKQKCNWLAKCIITK